MAKKDIKESFGYNTKPVQMTCSNCVHFSSIIVINEYNYPEEKEIKCTLGWFSVKKMANCNHHKLKQK